MPLELSCVVTSGQVINTVNFGVMAPAAEYSNTCCKTHINNVQPLLGDNRMMDLVKIVDRGEVGKPTPVPRNTKDRAMKRGTLSSPFITDVCVDDHGFTIADQSFSRVNFFTLLRPCSRS